MVVWLFAGGGYAEAGGLVPFLQKHLSSCDLQRKTPSLRRPGPRPSVGPPPVRRYAGSTGPSLQTEIRDVLRKYWDGSPQMILVLDDTDCDPDLANRKAGLHSTVTETLTTDCGVAVGNVPQVVVGFAVPEIETWLLADWNHTFAADFGRCHEALKHALATQGVRLSEPETFDCKPGTSEYRKISEVVIQAVGTCCQDRFSKATDTPRLLAQVSPAEVQKRCPQFNAFWTQLEANCR